MDLEEDVKHAASIASQHIVSPVAAMDGQAPADDENANISDADQQIDHTDDEDTRSNVPSTIASSNSS